MTDYILPPADVVAKEIPGFPGYWATDDGRIWSGRYDGRFLRPCIVNGYNTVVVRDGKKGWTKKVHRLVAMAWHGLSDLPLIRHLDGDEFNNTPSNLAYGTQKDNMLDEIRLGKYVRGSAGPTTKHSHDAARMVLELNAAGAHEAAIAQATSISRTMVRRIIRGESWPHLRRCPFTPPPRLLDRWSCGV